MTRLARLGVAADVAPSPAPLPPQNEAATLTPAMLSAALLGIGLEAGAENMALAQAFAGLGLPLTRATMTEAHVALAHAPGASPLSFALAKSRDLPVTPDVLRALTTVTDGIPARRALPAQVGEWLSLALDADLEPESLAAQLRLMVGQRARSTEGRLLASGERDAAVSDTRSLLLRLAQAAGDKQVRVGADTLASHIEGQQLINVAGQRDGAGQTPVPVYFALPLQLPAEQTMLELRCGYDEEARPGDWDDEEPGWRATVRLATTRLGRVEAELTGTPAGALICRLGAEQPGTVRLLQRGREKLTASLAALGWVSCAVHCQAQTDWPPLWHGGEALTAPRARVDRKA